MLSEKIKDEGLEVDFRQIREEGSRAVLPEDEIRLLRYGISAQRHPGYFMFRIRIPGGRVTSEQSVHLAELASIHGRGRLYPTARQSLALHWVRVEEAETIFEQLQTVGLSTSATCGSSLRNVTACTHGGVASDGIIDVQPWAALISDWAAREKPMLPGRLNVSFSGCPHCETATTLNDIGFVAVCRKSASGRDECGFELRVGGSLGVDGFSLRSFITLSEAMPACQTIVAIYDRFGSREQKGSRLKDLIEAWGRKRFTACFETLFIEKKKHLETQASLLPVPESGKQCFGWAKRLRMQWMSSPQAPLPAGAIPQLQKGLVQLTVTLPLGSIEAKTFSELAEIAKRFGDGIFHLTKNKEIELHGIGIWQLGRVTRRLKELGLSLKGRMQGASLLACVGSALCPLAVTHAPGAVQDLMKHLKPGDPEKQALYRSISIHISGCRNSCAKYQMADIGLAGMMLAVGSEHRYAYQLFVGGSFEGKGRMGESIGSGLTEAQVVPVVNALLDIVLEHRQERESFQKVMLRLGAAALTRLLASKMASFATAPSEEVPMVTIK